MLKHAATGLLLIPILGIGLMTVFTDYQVENIADELTERLMEILPTKACEKIVVEAAQTSDNSTPAAQSGEDQPEDIYGRRSSFDPAGPYNSRNAMEKRAQGLRDVCIKYKDFMRPENVMSEKGVDIDDMLVNAPSMTTFCSLPKVAQKPMATLFNRLRQPSQEEENRLKYFRANYPASMKEMKKAIMVRHPLERLISTFRNKYEKVYNPASGEEEGGEMEWLDFIYIVLNGPVEYAEFLEAHELDAGSIAIDTGMIDGLGESKSWAPYWLQCGVCNPLYIPDFILHLDHVKADTKTMLDILNISEDNYKGWMNTSVQPKSSIREVEEYYYNQLTKSEIKELYEKFQQDHELFGFSPEYYIALGQDD